jgi:hypothetical protein
MLTPEDRYRHSHIRFKSEVLRFVVQYETKFEGKWLPVVRYDTEHGYAHRDILIRKAISKKLCYLQEITMKPLHSLKEILSQTGGFTRGLS